MTTISLEKIAELQDAKFTIQQQLEQASRQRIKLFTDQLVNNEDFSNYLLKKNPDEIIEIANRLCAILIKEEQRTKKNLKRKEKQI